jgi:hypothetical protein
MAGAISTIVLLRRPTWGIGRRLVLVAGVGAFAALAAYLTAVGLQLLPGEPTLLVYAFLLTQLAGAQSIAERDQPGAGGRGSRGSVRVFPAPYVRSTDDVRREAVKP